MAAQDPDKHLVPTGFRLPPDLLRRVDAYAASLQTSPAISVKRSDVIRDLLERGLAEVGFGPTPKREARRG